VADVWIIAQKMRSVTHLADCNKEKRAIHHKGTSIQRLKIFFSCFFVVFVSLWLDISYLLKNETKGGYHGKET
jgi:hypothetical protein